MKVDPTDSGCLREEGGTPAGLIAHQPTSSLLLRQPIAYLAGVLKGDGWLGRYFGLRSKDEDFALAFVTAMSAAFPTRISPHRDERGYWLARATNQSGRFTRLRTFKPVVDGEKRAWLRGYFDSEGSAGMYPKRNQPENCYTRRVAMYSTNLMTLEEARQYLQDLGFETRLRATKNSASHKGTRTVYELRLAASQDAFRRFALMIGSSISRKQVVLDRLHRSYSDPAVYLRVAQARGVAAKRAKRLQREQQEWSL